MNKGIFVTATDTGVGKTTVSAAIIRLLLKRGIKAGAMKPLETGCALENGVLVPADGSFLREAAGMADDIDLVTPVRYEMPLAPYTASVREGVPVMLESVFSAYEGLSRKYEFMVVEGVGGVMVPLTKDRDGDVYFLIDLIKDLRLPAVVVTKPSLGTINHTILTVSRLIDEGIEVRGIIINNGSRPQGTIAEDTNIAMLRELSPVPLIGIVPYLGDVTAHDIDTKASACIDIEAIIE